MKIATLALLTVIPLMLGFSNPDNGSEADLTPARERVLFDFSAPDAEAWPALNDGVMGGLSRGSARIEGGKMVFTGRTRLENNGGFSSVRTRGKDWDLTGADEILVRMKANADRGYVFVLQAQAEGARGAISYWQKFKVVGDGYQTVSLPLADFYPTFRGSKLRGFKLEANRIRSFGLMIYDGKAGPFRMEVEWVKSAGEAQVSLAKSRRTVDPVIAQKAPSKTSKKAAQPNVVELAQAAGDFQTLLTAATKAGLVETLTSAGPFTVLAPSDNAFAALPKGTIDALLLPKNRDRLRQILLFHVLPGRLSATELISSGKLATAQGQELDFGIKDGRVRAGEAMIIANDLGASNGVVHVIDRVLLPALPPSNPVLELLEKAAQKGAPLYNEGQIKACAAIYEITVSAILALEGEELTEGLRDRLAEALTAAEKSDDPREAAWGLRRAMDATYEALSD
jgi:uncharacterized surface protein with fasciclin (FAS1) repeats